MYGKIKTKEPLETSEIISVLSPRTIKCSGQKYYSLVGEMDLSQIFLTKAPQSFIAFQDGFPENWKTLVMKAVLGDAYDVSKDLT